MRLRKPCEHGRYDTHYRDDPEDEFGGTLCPGGQLLPEGALVIEKVDGKWPDTAHLVARRWKASNDGTHHLLDALASQVGESE